MKKLAELDRLLAYMEENIDLEHIKKIEQLQYDAINYKKIDHLPLTIRTTPDGFNQIPLDEAYNDPEKMLYNEILWSTMHSSYNSVRTKDDGALQVRSNHGIGIIASLFGCKSLIKNNEMPWVEHLSLEEARKVIGKGVPELNRALGKEVIQTYQYYHQRLKEYPKCYEAIRITQTDMQGPYDIMDLIVGNEAFLLPYDDPEFLKEALDVIAQTYIDFRKFIDPYLTDKVGEDAVFVHGFCCGGKILSKADTASAILSAEMYYDFEATPTQKIMEAFKNEGGGSLHYCGEQKPWHYEKMYNEHLRCINFGNPEMQDLKKAYDFWSKRKVGIIGWGFNQEYSFIDDIFKQKIKTGMTLMTTAKTVEEGKEILKKYRERSM